MNERLTKENIEYVGDVYSKELHPMVHDLITENLILQSELAAEKEKRWHVIDENDTETFPPEDGLFEVEIETHCCFEYGHEYYSLNDGWATDQKIVRWRYIDWDGATIKNAL